MADDIFAVQLGEIADMGKGKHNNAFPFWLNFVSSEDDQWELVKSTDNLSGIGVTVPSGSTVLHPVRTYPDYNFHILSYRYTAYYDNQGEYWWYNNEPGFFLEQGDYQTAYGTPLINFLRVSINVSPEGRFVQGGVLGNDTATEISNTVNGLHPLFVDSVQGYDFGQGQLRTPYLMSRNGIIYFTITNTHPVKDLVVGGTVYGMKVRV